MNIDRVIEEFRAALRQHGLVPPERIEADGRIHRCDVDTRNGKGDGAYLLHLNEIAAGGFQNWQNGGWQDWCAREARTLTPDERARLRRAIGEARRQREEEAKRRQTEARDRATREWESAGPAPADHRYLTRKGVNPHGLRMYRGTLTVSGTECDGALIVPLRDSNGDLHSLEFITAEGEKRFLPGGRTSGCHFGIGTPSGVIVIAEGFATAASVHEATGHAVVCAFNAGNLLNVAVDLRSKLAEVRIIIAADNDENGAGQERAHEAARAVRGNVAIPDDAGADWNDVLLCRGADAVRAGVEAAEAPQDAPGSQPHGESADGDSESSRIASRIAELAQLSRVDYDRVRKSEAKELGMRAPTLDAEVAILRKELVGDSTLTFEDPEPWPAEANGIALLDEVRNEVERYLVLPPHASIAIALWALHTWCLDAFFVTPFLYPRSPEKRCGKTTLMLVIHELVRRPLLATNVAPAPLFRCIEEFRPTLLLDEADTWLRENEELRGILNGGHSRKTARVIRCVGDEHEVRAFSTFCPKAIAGIGRLADTLEDRSIVIPMKRKRTEDRKAPLREDRLDLLEIRRRCRRWADDHLEALRNADPQTPSALNDRAADNWRALLAIADAAGGEWPQEARLAAVALSGQTDDEAIGVQLLTDIREYFSREGNAPAVLSRNSVAYLVEIEGRPWAEWGKGDKPISQNQVARLLKGFEIQTRDVRDGPKVAKGYLQEHFSDAFTRYLPTASQRATALQPHQFGSQTDISDSYSDLDPKRYNATDDAECSGAAVERNSEVADQNDTKGYKTAGCSGVAVRNVPDSLARDRADDVEVF